MSVLSQKFTAILTTIKRLPSMAVSDFHTLTLREQTTPKTGCIFGSFVRTNIRVHFPRPSERKRVTLHGWKKRMSTPSGREILMRRILKGRHVYSH